MTDSQGLTFSDDKLTDFDVNDCFTVYTDRLTIPGAHR